jgi:acylphosphatase
MEIRRVLVTVSGRVQGVGYRRWTERQALQFGLKGWVRNRADGAVEAEFEGPAEWVDRMVESLHTGPAHAEVENVEVRQVADSAKNLDGFKIVESV